ncbi:MAG: asparaginase [Pyrinomonadaceae bacterium]|nr:asparaginase [Phycisphaerales bacterium]
MQHITLIATGGTIEKVYVEETGELTNRGSIVRRMLSRLRLEDIRVSIIELMSKDSLFMTDQDRSRILEAVVVAVTVSTGVVVLHGTDTLTLTGDLLAARIASPPVPVILTGAMRPYEMKRSDALQNLTESIFAAAILPPAIYCVAHGQALKFPGVTKDRARGTFVRTSG